jgi:hypothetical protein
MSSPKRYSVGVTDQHDGPSRSGVPFSEAPKPQVSINLEHADRQTLRRLAFNYHYGSYGSAEEAYRSVSYSAAYELVRRQIRFPHLPEPQVPKPNVFGCVG